jgi:uncharacterized protein with HEPN domain
MRLEAKKYLYDMQRAAALITEFTAGRELQDYHTDAMLRSAVERQFEIIGDASAQLARIDASVAHHITAHRRIIAFRNILIHGYTDVDDRLVWDIVTQKLPLLRNEIDSLLTTLESPLTRGRRTGLTDPRPYLCRPRV